MKRTKLSDRKLPYYTKGEEIFNMTSHIVGGAMGVAATALCVIFAAVRANIYGVIGGAIFGATMIILYTISSTYHGLKSGMSKKVLQIIDHCSIYLLIAGTYTPFCLCTLREHNPALGWSIFGIVWGLAALGITLKSIDLKKFRVVSMILYLGMGWCVIFTVKTVFQLLGTTGFILLMSGGIAYTLGAILFGLGIKYRYAHSVFHIFVVIGSLLHFLCVLFFVM